MRYREESPTGDYQFGGANDKFLVNSPECVIQAIKTRLALFVGEWFLDTDEGLDRDLIVGHGTYATADLEIRDRILGTPGVRSIISYTSSVENRHLTVNVTVDTIYGQATTVIEV